MRVWFAGLALLATGCTLSPGEQAQIARHDADQQRKLAKVLKGLVPVETNDCLNLSLVRSAPSQIYGNTVLYRVSSGNVYRTDTQGDCGSTGLNNALVTSTPTGQLCRGDIARTVDPVAGFQTGSCTIGRFTTYRRP